MMVIPRVSVIIPSYNRANSIKRAVQSVLDQTFSDLEIIIIDDGSQDNTKEIIQAFKDERIKYLRHDDNRGVSAARNTGIKVAMGEYIAFLDSDDEWLLNNLEVKVQVLNSHSDIDIVSSDGYILDDKTGVILRRYWNQKITPGKLLTGLKGLRLDASGFSINVQGILVRGKVFKEIGFFDESLRIFEDWDIFVRMNRHFSTFILDMPLFKYHKHGDNMTYHWEIMYPGVVAVITKALNRNLFTANEIRLLKSWLAKNHFIEGRRLLVSGENKSGRDKLIESVKSNPWFISSYMWLGLSLTGNGVIATIRSIKNRWESRKISADILEN